MNWRDFIEQRPDVMMGKPVFKGTRLTVETVLQRLGDGGSEKELLDSYPRLTPDHIKAARMRRPTREEFEDALKLIPSRPPLPGVEVK